MERDRVAVDPLVRDSDRGRAISGAGAAAGRPNLERTRRHFWSLSGGIVRRVELFRLVLGAVWAIDAYYKWQPDFVSSYASTVAEGGQGQPGWLHWWFRFWTHAVRHNPHAWAYGTAAIETLIAIALIVGFARRTTYTVGALWSLGIWTVAEGFGGVLTKGATDVGTAIMYALGFAMLYALETLPAATGAWSLDHRIERRLPWWRALAEPAAGGATPAT